MRQIKLSLLILTTILAVSLPAYAEDRSSSATTIAQANSTDLITVGASIINGLINPPSRSAEITADAEVRKAKIAAEAEISKEKLRIEASKRTDRVTPVLNQWGVAQVACAPDLVFINGITSDTICIQPTSTMTAGYYTYDSAKQQLVRNSANIQTANSTNVQNSQNVQTVQNIQSTKVSNPTSSSSNDRGF
jgi:hypothetical protein